MPLPDSPPADGEGEKGKKVQEPDPKQQKRVLEALSGKEVPHLGPDHSIGGPATSLPPQTCSGGVQRDALSEETLRQMRDDHCLVPRGSPKPPTLGDIVEARLDMHRQAHPGDKPAQAEESTT